MVSFKDFSCTSVRLEDAVGALRRVEPDSQEVLAAISVGTSFGNSRLKLKRKNG
jgi:hypothetical protein